ncbi:hypothetical protein C0993_004771 [Termitomyces sp. T159_Od127]|nr:hypothetical protein C0993_004771 [Termitomyces sp. T159_Od127]
MLAAIVSIALCLSQLSLVSGSESQIAKEEVAPLEDPKCPHGLYPGLTTNEWQFTTPASAFINKTGSFLHGEWYTGPINSTHGKDNAIGASRDVIFGGSLFIERLVGSYNSPTQSVLRYVLANGPVEWNHMVFGSYTEELRAMSICGGTATQYTMTATYCTNDLITVYNLYDVYRRQAVQAVANELGTLVFSGTCPYQQTETDKSGSYVAE